MSARESKAMRAVRDALAEMIWDSPFYGNLALGLELREEQCGTAATDGVSLLFDPAFMEKCTATERKGVIAHEVMHCALLHHCRRGERDPELWNIAGDIRINFDLETAGFSLPALPGMPHKQPWALHYNDAGKWDTESIYRDLMQSGRHQKKGINTVVSFGAVRDAPAPQPGQGSEDTPSSETVWSNAVARAARAAGPDCPKFARRHLANITTARVNYRELLARWTDEVCRTNPTWAQPHRRLYAATGFYLPARRERTIGTLCVIVDTSGSMGRPDVPQSILAQACADVRNVAELAERTIAYAIDTRIRWQREFTRGEPLDIQPHGGGGTDLRAAMSTAAAEMPAAIIVLTDLEIDDPGPDPNCPVLWLCWRDYRDAPPAMPYGEVIVMRAD